MNIILLLITLWIGTEKQRVKWFARWKIVGQWHILEENPGVWNHRLLAYPLDHTNSQEELSLVIFKLTVLHSCSYTSHAASRKLTYLITCHMWKINAFDNNWNEAYRRPNSFCYSEQSILSEIYLNYNTASLCNCIHLISHHFNSEEFFFPESWQGKKKWEKDFSKLRKRRTKVNLNVRPKNTKKQISLCINQVDSYLKLNPNLHKLFTSHTLKFISIYI